MAERRRCQALDDNGVQCRREAGYEVYYHGEPGVNDKCPGWVLVRMCDQHSSSSADRRKLKDDRCAALAETPTESLEAVLAPHGLLREKVRAIKHLIPEPYRAEIGKLLADSWDACDALDTLRAEAGREAIGKKTWEIENGTSYHPENCPVTGRPFFMTIEDESGKMVATYGGPFDSYTIPEWNAEDDEFRSERYDHDAGAWVDGGEPYEIILRDEQEWLRLKTLEDEQTAIRKKAGRERAVRELEALAKRADNGGLGRVPVIWAGGVDQSLRAFSDYKLALDIRERLEEIAKEGK